MQAGLFVRLNQGLKLPNERLHDAWNGVPFDGSESRARQHLAALANRRHVAQLLPLPAMRTPLGEAPKRVRNSRLKCETSEKPISSAMSEIRCALS
jgi:hypothetical protein